MTAKRRAKLLVERCIERVDVLPSLHVRAELNRLARQMRKLEDVGAFIYKRDVLDAIKAAKR